MLGKSTLNFCCIRFTKKIFCKCERQKYWRDIGTFVRTILSTWAHNTLFLSSPRPLSRPPYPESDLGHNQAFNPSVSQGITPVQPQTVSSSTIPIHPYAFPPISLLVHKDKTPTHPHPHTNAASNCWPKRSKSHTLVHSHPHTSSTSEPQSSVTPHCHHTTSSQSGISVYRIVNK